MKNRNFNKLFSFSFKNLITCAYAYSSIWLCMCVKCLLGESCGTPPEWELQAVMNHPKWALGCNSGSL